MNTDFIRLQGGLGNQLFQLAFILGRAIETSQSFVILNPKGPRKFALSFLGIEPNRKYNASIIGDELHIQKVSIFLRYPYFVSKKFEDSFGFQEFKGLRSSSFFHGYFQSFRYFQDIEVPLRNYLLNKLFSKPFQYSDVPTIHIRLGDYITNPQARKVHGIVSSNYIDAGINQFNTDKNSCRIVTDDFSGLEAFFPELYKEIDSQNIFSGGQLSDFRLLAGSKNLIIANSTFSWWAAYLADGKVVAPKQWFINPLPGFESRNFFPQDWTLI